MTTKAKSPKAFEPIHLKGVEIPNRLWAAPMCQYSSRDGFANHWQLVHLGSLALRQAGLVLTEATAIHPEGRITPDDAGIWSEEHASAWEPTVNSIHEQGGLIGIQLAHAGRKASTHSPAKGRGDVHPADGGWETRAPSPIAYGDLRQPREMSTSEISSTTDDFVSAARRAVNIGFDAVEIHAAHGYLLHQFLSPASNKRTDEYGGPWDNRARCLIEVCQAVRAEIPNVPLLVRLSGTGWISDGWTIEDTQRVSILLEQVGVDLLDISSGGLDPRQSIPVGPSYQVPLANAVRSAVSIPVATVGLVTSPPQAESILVGGAADAILLGRELLRDPHFPLKAANELGGHLEWPSQYRMAKFEGSIP